MHRRLLIALTLLLTGCGGATSPSTTLETTTTAAAAASSSSTTTATGDEGATTSSAVPESTTEPPADSTTTTTTTTIGGGTSAIRIDEIVFAGGPYVVISNQGTGVGSTLGYWICQFPSYYELPTLKLLPGEKIAVSLGAETLPDLVGMVATVDVSSPVGDVTTVDGELGLYSENTFNSPDAIVDYVEWGMGGHARSSVAVAAGIWQTDGFIEVSPETLAIVAQAFPSVGPDDWSAEIGG